MSKALFFEFHSQKSSLTTSLPIPVLVYLSSSFHVVEKALPSPNFFYAPLSKDGSVALILPPQVESLATSMEEHLFDSLEDIPTLSMFFTRLLTLTSQKILDENVEVISSLALATSEAFGISLMVVPL